MTNSSRQNPQLGDIVAIPLPDGRFAYARVYRGTSIGVFVLITDQIVEIQDVSNQKTAFNIGCLGEEIKKGAWPIIGSVPFENEAESWPPPRYVQDIIKPTEFRIFYKDEMRAATPEEAAGLEKAALYPPQFIIERILKELG